MGDDREALARLIDPTFDSLSVTGTPYWQRILATADRILAAGWCRPPEPQAAASEVVERAVKYANDFIACWGDQQPDPWPAMHTIMLQQCRALLAEHARAEAAERELELAQVGLFHDSDGAQYSLLETKKILREREAAEAAVKRLTEAGAELHRAVMADMRGLIDPGEALAQDRRNRLWKAEAAWRAALAPGGGDGR